jgi:CheY-specific phosphatase CheX
MQAIELKPFMESAVAEVLESMCFMSSEGEVSDDAGNDLPNWICGELDFVGLTGGTFGIAVPPSTASVIASNFLGEEETDLSEKQTVEVVCELTNMVCGTFLAHLDAKQAFTLSPPRHIIADKQVSAKSGRVYGTYSIDDGLIYAWLELQVAA